MSISSSIMRGLRYGFITLSEFDDRGQRTSLRVIEPRINNVTFRDMLHIVWSERANRISFYCCMVYVLVITLLVLYLIFPNVIQFSAVKSSTVVTINLILDGGLLILMVFPAIVMFMTRSKQSGWICYWLSQSQCPQCLADMHGQAVEEDDCVVCGECGAAWKLSDRIAQP